MPNQALVNIHLGNHQNLTPNWVVGSEQALAPVWFPDSFTEGALMMPQTDQDGQVQSLASKRLQQDWGQPGPKKLHYILRGGFFEEVQLYSDIQCQPKIMQHVIFHIHIIIYQQCTTFRIGFRCTKYCFLCLVYCQSQIELKCEELIEIDAT